jgi:hypothetical protein
MNLTVPGLAWQLVMLAPSMTAERPGQLQNDSCGSAELRDAQFSFLLWSCHE